MAARMTEIRLCSHTGLVEYGRKTPEEMIAAFRKMAELDLRRASAILAAPDDAFLIETYIGVNAIRNVEILQEGRRNCCGLS